MSRFTNNGTEGIQFAGHLKHCYSTKLDRIRIAICDLVSVDESPLQPNTWITRINVPKQFRGKGHASQLLDRVCADADTDQVTLWLDPAASDGLSQRKLIAWYKRRGFKFAGRPGKSSMYREPTKPKADPFAGFQMQEIPME